MTPDGKKGFPVNGTDMLLRQGPSRSSGSASLKQKAGKGTSIFTTVIQAASKPLKRPSGKSSAGHSSTFMAEP